MKNRAWPLKGQRNGCAANDDNMGTSLGKCRKEQFYTHFLQKPSTGYGLRCTGSGKGMGIGNQGILHKELCSSRGLQRRRFRTKWLYEF